MDEDLEGEEFGVEVPPLAVYIKGIIERYPAGQIFKELIQNADDAGARTVHFFLDTRTHSQHSLVNPALAQFQGPALLAYNDAQFTAEDWKNIQKPQQSFKQDDPLKVGKFGIGFNSVYHITDLPTIISGTKVAFIEPFGKIWPGKFGRQFPIGQSNVRTTLAPFNGICEFSTKLKKYSHTLFRFPLRQSPSRLSETCYSIDMLHELIEALKEEAQYLLLFLHSVIEVQVFEISSSCKQNELFRVWVHDHESISRQREAFNTNVQIACTQHSQQCYTTNFYVETNDTSCDQTESKHWLVVNTVGSRRSCDWVEADKLKVLPWAGCALELSEDQAMDLSASDSDLSRAGSDDNTSFLGQGRIFCFLPMPKETCSPLPVHVNGTFGLNDDRRTLKWPSGERRHDLTANWNMTIISHLLPTCYAQLILEAIKLGVSYEQVYNAWPQIQRIEGTNWSGLIKPLLSIILQKEVFWFVNASLETTGSWISLDNATFIPQGEELSIVVERVLFSCGLKLVSIPDHIWDAIDDEEVNEVSSTLLRHTLRSHSDVYECLPAEDKHELLLYCLFDEKYEDLSGLKLLPLANGIFQTFKRISAQAYYVCSDQHPCSLLPKLEDHLVDLSSINEDLHTELLNVASSGKTQLQQLDAKSVAKLLPHSMPDRWKHQHAISVSGSDFPLQWFKIFWEWVQYYDLRLFTNQMVLPIVRQSSREEHKIWVTRLVTESKVIFMSHSDDLASELLMGLEKIGLYFTGDSDNLFPYLQCVHRKLLFYKFVSSATPDGVLGATIHSYKGNMCSLQDIEFSDIQAQKLQHFISRRGVFVNEHKQVILWLPIFKAVNRKHLCSIESASRNSWERRAVLECAGGFDISPNLLPPNLVVFSSAHNETGLIHLYPSKVSAPSKMQFIQNVLIPMISSKKYPDCLLDNLMVEILQQFLTMKWNPWERSNLRNKLSELPFVKFSSTGCRKAPNQLFDIAKKELKDLFKDKPVFPQPPFTQTHLLTALRECGLRQSVKAQEIVDIILSIGTEPASSTRKSRARAVLKYLNMNPNLLCQKVMYENIWCNFDAILPSISKKTCWLPVEVKPPHGYPNCLEWKGRSCVTSLAILNSSVLICCEEDADPLSFILGSQMYIVSCSSNLSKLFQNHVPLQQIGLHFQQVIAQCKNIGKEILHYIVRQTYKHFSRNLQHDLRNVLPTSWLWIRKHNVFISSQEAVLHPHPSLRQDLDPYLFIVPEDLKEFSNLFKTLGVVEHFTKSQALSVLATIKNKRRHPRTSNRDSWTIVTGILNWLTADGAFTLDPGEVLYVPIESESHKLRLEDSNTVCYADDQCLKAFLSTVDEQYTLCHDRISHLAPRLGITPLSQHLDISDDMFDDVGQHEPLDVRIRGILRDYTDGLTIIKELLQNADDAGATEVNLCFDTRHHKTKPRIFPDMAKCCGQALIVHNNKVFTDEDFESITKLAGATKQNKPLKIGKFGVGFCSVYHITDVPSFVSREYFCVFDPTLKCLREHIRDTSRPGKKVKFTRECIQRSGLLAPYRGLYGFDPKKPFEGTIFRFPFRTSASILSSILYNEHDINKLIEDVQRSSSKLLLFLQNIQHIFFSQVKEGDSSPQVLLHIQKHASESLCVDAQLLKIEFDIKQTRHSSHYKEVWLVSPLTEKVRFLSQERDGTASVACQLQPSSAPHRYTVKEINGEAFCFLPLSLQSGLPVHVSANFAVLNDRTGIRSSDEHDIGTKEAEWNMSLMKTLIPKAYLKLLLCLSQMHTERDLKYNFCSLWPLKAKLMVHNPWDALIRSLYLLIAGERLLYSKYTSEWLTMDESRFLSSDILCLTPNSSTPDCVYDVVSTLHIPIIDLPSEYMVHLPKQKKETCIIKEREFVDIFFEKIEHIPVTTRNTTLYTFVKSLSMYPEDQDLSRVLRENCCIPCSPDGQQLKKCHEIVDPKAPFAPLYSLKEGMFPEKQFICSSTCPAMTSLGMITDYLPWDMLTERAGTISRMRNKSEALQRAKIVLNCINDNLSRTSYQSQRYPMSSCPSPESAQYCSQLQTIKFLPVKPRPKDYPACLSWCGGDSSLLSAKEVYIGESCELLAGSQVCLLCTQKPELGGCGYITKKVISGLGIKTQPSLSAVIQHFHHIITVFMSLRDRGKPQSISHEWLDDVCSKIYEFLEELKDVSRSELCTLPCIWTGSDFVHTNAVALNCTYSGPYLFKVPNSLREKTSLLKILQIKEDFTMGDIQATLKQMKDEFKENPISKECRKLIPSLLTDLTDMLKRARTEGQKTLDIDVFLPDEHFVMQRASKLAYNDAPWCKPTSDIPFVSSAISREVAVKLGVQPVRSKFLELYEGEEFGQSEELTQRIRNILRDYPLDITILKELLQNADDAKATKMYVILDKRTHGMDKLPSDEWKELQGPALLVWNNSTFQEEDFKGIQKLGLGSKRSEAETIGMYGIGFNAVYHLTDCPSFISTEKNGKSTLCVLDPHCRYIPGAKKLRPGRRFNNLDRKFWAQWSDLRSTYLKSSIFGLPEEMKGGSLFRFPLRHKELFHKSELVDHARLVKNKTANPISASLMQKYLKEWCSDLKQALFFLNNVTELKVFEVNGSATLRNNSMQLIHWYEAKIDDHAKTSRALFQQKVQRFESKSTPCLERYTLSLVEKGLGHEEDVTEKWFIQQGVGDIDNPQQEWHFLPHMKPKHGIAAPLCAPNKAYELRRKSQLFCFLPLQVFSNLPVHVNGSFVLDSSRRKLWQSAIPDGQTKWNERVLEAIASSYAEFLVQSQVLYIDPVNTTKKTLWNGIHQYYNAFPTWLEKNKHFPPPEDKECLSVAKMVYHRLLTRNARILVHIKEKANGIGHEVKYLPLLDIDTPQNQAYFWDGKKNIDGLGSVLQRIGMQLTVAPMRILRHLLEFKECRLCEASGKAVFIYYSRFHGQVSPNGSFPQHISGTSFESVDAFKLFTEHMLQTLPEQVGLTFPGDPSSLPLLLTSDNQLRKFLKEDNSKAIRSQFSLLFCQHAGEHFLHFELLEVRYTENYFMQPSRENWDKIHSILAMTLPSSLDAVMLKNASEHINLLKALWECLAKEEVFYIHLDSIVKTWALIPSTWDQQLSVFSTRSQILPIIPPHPQCPEIEVFHIIQDMGMPIFDVTSAKYGLCCHFCPTLSQPHLILHSLYHFYCQDYMQHFLNNNQRLPSAATALLKYFGKIHLSQEPKSLKQVKSLPLFKEISGNFRPITGNVFVWPGNVCEAGQQVWLQTCPDTVFLERNGDWKYLGTADTLHISLITEYDVYSLYIFPVFDQLTEEERFKHLQHIRDHLFKDAEMYSKLQDDFRKPAAKTFIINLKKLPCLSKDGVLQPLCEFSDPQMDIFTEFESFNIFPPEHMQDETWLRFLRKIGLRTTVSQEEFLHYCHQVEEGKCSHIQDASTALLEYLFGEKNWHSEESFLNNVSVIAFVVVECLEKLSKIKACKLHEKIVQAVPLTSLCRAAEYKDARLIWTVMPVVRLPFLHITVDPFQKRKLLHLLKVREVTTKDVIQNIINVSHTDFSNFSNFDKYPQQFKEPKHHSLVDVLLTNFKYLNDKCSKDYEGLLQLRNIPCIPVCADGNVEEITRPVLVKPLQVIAMEPEALKPFARFLNPLPQDFYSCLHHILSTIGVQQKVTLRHVRGALEDILQHTYETLDVNTMEVVRNFMQMLQKLLQNRQKTSEEESDLDLSPLYLPNTDQHLVKSTSLLFEDIRYFKNEKFSFEGLPYSKFSLLTKRKDIWKEKEFCLALPEAIAPKPLSTSCSQEMSASCEEVQPSSLVEKLQKTFSMVTLAAAVCALLRSRGYKLSEKTQTSICKFFHNASFITVMNLSVNVYLRIVEPPACIGTAEVDFHVQRQCNGRYILYVVEEPCVPRIYKSMAALILPIVVEMSDPTITASQDCEEVLSKLLMANNTGDIRDILSEHHVSLSNTEDLSLLTSFDPNVEPRLGRPIPESWHHRLQQDIDNVFRAGEWVGYEKADEIIVFARIGYRVENEDNELESFDQYLIHVEERDPDGIVVSVVSIYKILRTLRKQPNSFNEGLLVVYDGNSDTAKLRRKFDTEELKRAKKVICEELRRIWKLPEELRRRAIKRMYLKWHPDKHNNKALAEKAFQFLIRQISLLEEGQPLEDPEKEGSGPLPAGRRTAWNPWYETWDEIVRRHRETRRQDQHEEGFNLPGPQPQPHNARVWITQAECDLEALTILKNATKYNQRVCANVCFLAHEVAEKSLKAGMFAVCGLDQSDLKHHHLITNYAGSLHHEKPRFTEGLTGHVAAVSNFYNRTRWPNQYTPHQVPADHYYPNQANEAEEHAKAIFQMMKALVNHMAPR